MDFPSAIKIVDIATWIGAKIVGDPSGSAIGINEIHKVRKRDITFVDVEKYYAASLESDASFIILDKEIDCPPGKTLLITSNPFKAYESIVQRYRAPIYLKEAISAFAKIHPSSSIEPGVIIGPHVEIGEECHLQANCIIHPHTIIGNNVEIQPGAIISSDAFYFKKVDNKYHKWTSGGRVVIEDDVLIGAGCTINKGVSGDTVIGEGSKLDCQIHVGHGVVIGKNCLIAAQVGIGGKTIIEDNVTIYGQVGIIHNVTIGKGATILAGAGVARGVPAGKTYFGAPADEARIVFRQLAALKRLAGQ